MSLMPPELRALCFKLSSLPTLELPYHVPVLLRYVQYCQAPLSSAIGSAAKSDPSSALVLIHKLKTQLTALLAGRVLEARFTAVILIKAVVEVGGWEVLQSSEPWVRGILNILAKPDPAVIKEMCILALTKIYLMTHQYQTLIREITTPTLPAYVTSCLNLLSSKSTTKAFEVPSSLIESIFRSFAMLIPGHPSIFRPFTSQIRLVTRPYLAPNVQEQSFVSSDLREAARQLSVVLHQTAAKNSGGEEWSRAVQEIVREIHKTADNVFRAVTEDWESNSGYVSEPVNVNSELSGGNDSGDLPIWTGIDAGADRLQSLLEILAEYFRTDTPGPTTTPLGSIIDLYTRMLSINIPSVSGNSSKDESIRLHPAISREERDGLWARMSGIYITTLRLILAVAERLKENFVPIAQACFDQLTWVFPHGKHIEDFRSVSFEVTAKILRIVGNSLDKSQVDKATTIVRACCQDLCPNEELSRNVLGVVGSNHIGPKKLSSNNADSYLRSLVSGPYNFSSKGSALQVAASQLLPLLISYIPQQHIDISLRSLTERTAVLSKNKAAMLASILNPFVGNNGRAMTSILPHLASAFGSEEIVEVLLRPRMPLLPTTNIRSALEPPIDQISTNEDMDFQLETDPAKIVLDAAPADLLKLASAPSLTRISSTGDTGTKLIHQSTFGVPGTSVPIAPTSYAFTQPPSETSAQQLGSIKGEADAEMVIEDTSDDESVHLTMQLDSESEGE